MPNQDAAKKKKRKRRSSTKIVLDKLVVMPHGELARLPAELVKADLQVAKFLWQELDDAISAAQDVPGEQTPAGDPPLSTERQLP